jgi:hypothetical protein
LASEYQNTMASATGDSTKVSHPSIQAANTNSADETTMNPVASPDVIAPRGSSRDAVRGLSASYRASASRLNPMAALRAATMATTIHATRQPTTPADHSPVRCRASSAPVRANGSANTECEKRTNDP